MLTSLLIVLTQFILMIMITEVVVSLEAPDEFLKNRVMNLPESVVAGTHNTEEGEFFPLSFRHFSFKKFKKIRCLSHGLTFRVVCFAGLMRRLVEFRAINTEDETVLNYFDELEIHPDHIGEFSKMSFVKTEIS